MALDERKRPGVGCAAVRLTRQECDVLAASARGAGVGEVASELGMADHDVRELIASSIRRLGAGSKLEAVIIALRRGDIRP